MNLIKSIFKSWFPVQLRKRPPFGTPVLSQHIPIHAGSLGRVQGQVDFFRKILRVPLATAATRTPYVIYLENRSRISKGDRKTKTSKKRFDNSTSTMIHKQDHHQDPTLILLLALGTLTWSSLQGSHVGLGDPSQLARPSPLWDGVPLFSAPRRPMTNSLMRGSRPWGYK
jgi:hypothetical protein